MPGANVQSSEAIRRFRERFVKFDATCQQALGSARTDVSHFAEWLDREKRAYWERQLSRRSDEVERARGEFIRASQEDKYQRKSSAVDERKALERALRRKEEAETKLEAVRHWTRTLEHKAVNLLQPCATLSGLLTVLTPQALARLDRMLDSLEAYRQAGSSAPRATDAPVQGGAP